MKTNERRLREAVKVALQARDCVRFSAEWDRAWGLVQATFDATAGDPEMDRLVKWLQQDEGDYVSSEMQFTVIKVSRLLDHIRDMQEERP